MSNTRTQSCGYSSQTLFQNFSIGESFSFSLSVVDTTLKVWTSKGAFKDYPYTWMNASVPLYFKAGAFPQQVGDTGY